MVVLLAGGAGYIGSHTAVELLNAGHEVVIVDDYSNSCPESIKRVEEITGKKVVSYEADVKDKEAMQKIFAENHIDCVIHFAGLKAVRKLLRLYSHLQQLYMETRSHHIMRQCIRVTVLIHTDGLSQ